MLDKKPPYDAALFCDRCGATPIEGTALCPVCSGETPYIIPHERCPVCGAPLGIRNKTLYENWTDADGVTRHKGCHGIIERTGGGTPESWTCPDWFDFKMDRWRGDRGE